MSLECRFWAYGCCESFWNVIWTNFQDYLAEFKVGIFTQDFFQSSIGSRFMKDSRVAEHWTPCSRCFILLLLFFLLEPFGRDSSRLTRIALYNFSGIHHNLFFPYGVFVVPVRWNFHGLQALIQKLRIVPKLGRKPFISHLLDKLRRISISTAGLLKLQAEHRAE